MRHASSIIVSCFRASTACVPLQNQVAQGVFIFPPSEHTHTHCFYAERARGPVGGQAPSRARAPARRGPWAGPAPGRIAARRPRASCKRDHHWQDHLAAIAGTGAFGMKGSGGLPAGSAAPSPEAEGTPARASGRTLAPSARSAPSVDLATAPPLNTCVDHANHAAQGRGNLAEAPASPLPPLPGEEDRGMRWEWAYVLDGRVLGPHDPRPPGLPLRLVHGRAAVQLAQTATEMPGGPVPDEAATQGRPPGPPSVRAPR